ncbi:response regulator transcription factor [Venenivibrio stagnispumantis]|uniref:DNA-binding response regulator, OmpR family, contains REC and winged-helix (WHTH) domain n=1 Tax=Venenivibrio stagnispumantis TaxID=407998 RepID=A0AA45WMK1_9AQUI|nr:response regulator transcription factor [Venenivibrio stagnispumantis]MCW4572789.1 response regulator transcription factor [Venenivibrio stagnispumantis]SMP13789.1 DNA-binding response regulator, OmpR family, contains REC and winged-helix (wHTH) domain [Venenivibrio stagnispumantis]
MRILVVEDDNKLLNLISKKLKEEGFEVDKAKDAEEGLNYILYQNYDVIILDIMLPKMSGFQIIETVRKKGIKTPILILSAKESVEDKVKGLSIGADDYLTKPFSFPELIARINALIRRTKNIEEFTKIKYADLTIDLVKKEVFRNNKKIDLTAKEFELLEYLAKNAEKIVTRNMILQNVFDINFDINSNIVDVHIFRLREKIDRGFDKKLIHTVRGFGYVLKTDES